jgi:DNA-binding HxlR family transcriptional regulator
LTATTVNRGGTTPRTGAQALTLLGAPPSSTVLQALSKGPMRPAELRREFESQAKGALRSHLGTLERVGVIAKHRPGPFPAPAEYELTGAGWELRFVAGALDRWLAGAPEEPLQLGSDAARAAVDALVEGWSSTALGTIVAQPPSATEPDPTTDWMRLGIGPIVAASRWERRNIPDRAAEIGRVDAEAALMLTMPRVQLPPTATGSCRLVVEVSNGSESESAAVTVAAENGTVVSCVAGGSRVATWATGSPNAWFRAAIEADPDHLDLGGDRRLARSLLESLYGALYGRRASRIPFRY